MPQEEKQYQVLFKGFKRLSGFALDDSGIFKTYKELEEYLASGMSYEGQLLVVTEDKYTDENGKTVDNNGLYLAPKYQAPDTEYPEETPVQLPPVKVASQEEFNSVVEKIGTTNENIEKIDKVIYEITGESAIGNIIPPEDPENPDEPQDPKPVITLKSLRDDIDTNTTNITTNTDAIKEINSKIKAIIGTEDIDPEFKSLIDLGSELNSINAKIIEVLEGTNVDEVINTFKEVEIALEDIEERIDLINNWFDKEGINNLSEVIRIIERVESKLDTHISAYEQKIAIIEEDIAKNSESISKNSSDISSIDARVANIENDYVKDSEFNDKVIEIVGNKILSSVKTIVITYKLDGTLIKTGMGISSDSQIIPENSIIDSINVSVTSTDGVFENVPSVFEVRLIDEDDNIICNMLSNSLGAKVNYNQPSIFIDNLDEEIYGASETQIYTVDTSTIGNYEYNINYATDKQYKISVYINNGNRPTDLVEGLISIKYYTR